MRKRSGGGKTENFGLSPALYNWKGMSCRGDRRNKEASHPDDELIESYVMGHLPEAELSKMGGHFFICERCRVRAAQTESYIAAMRRAMRYLAARGKNRSFTAAAL
jgi:hypothetical protein